jgi:hypothetical protein
VKAVFLSVVLLAGCTSENRVPGLLCTTCTDDSQCGGNPCFLDASGARFCGSACDNCPSGFSCHPVAGTSGTADSCFPDSLACPAGGLPSSQDLSVAPSGNHDMAVPPGSDLSLPKCTPPSSSGVTNSGGTVDRL